MYDKVDLGRIIFTLAQIHQNAQAAPWVGHTFMEMLMKTILRVSIIMDENDTATMQNWEDLMDELQSTESAFFLLQRFHFEIVY